MASQHSELFECLARLRDSARRGDWTRVEQVALEVNGHSVPLTREGLAQYLRELEDTLVVTKAARANAKASLVRLTAAEKFNAASLSEVPMRQNIAVTADI